MSESRDSKAHKNKRRPARVPLSSGSKFHVPAELKKKGYQYYFEVDRPGRIHQMEAAYWEKVKNEDGTDYTIPAGGGETHYLMRIEQKYYEEDMANQQQRNIDATSKQAQALGEDEYVPMENGVQRKAVAQRDII